MTQPDDSPRQRARSSEELQAIAQELVACILAELEAIRRPAEPQTLAAAAPPAGSLTRRTRRLSGWGVATLLIGALLLVWRLPMPEKESIPDELVGAWTTATPSYDDVSFRILRDSLVFRSGDHVGAYEITRVRGTYRGPMATSYVVEYANRGNVYEFSLVYYPPQGGGTAPNVSTDGFIQLTHQAKMDWRRSDRSDQ